MNTFVVIFLSACFVTLALAEETDHLKQRKAAAETCKTELNADDDVTKILDKNETPTSEAQSCFLDCVYGKMGIIKDGKINKDAAQAFAKARFGDNKDKLAQADALFKKCDEEATSNASNVKCGLAKSIRSCVVANGKDLNIFGKSR